MKFFKEKTLIYKYKQKMTYKINGHLHKYLISLCEFQKNFPLPSFSEKKNLSEQISS